MDDEVEAFQRALLEVLATAADGESALRALRERPEALPFREWLAGCEPRMVALAATLLRRWGAETGMAPPDRAG